MLLIRSQNYHIVMYRRIAKQRLGKHIPPGVKSSQQLLSNGSVNTYEIIRDNRRPFSVGSSPRLYNWKFQDSSQLLSEVERVQLKKSSFE
jgi:hypothetical protein